MSKKAKFNLLSILIEDKLIFYKSINKTRKFVAFSLFSANDVPKITIILNDLIKKRILKSYSIQIGVSSKLKNIFLLYFEDQEKERILNSFYLIYDKLLEKSNCITFFQKNKLRRNFFNIFSGKVTSETEITLNREAICLRKNRKILRLNCFHIKINLISNKTAFLNTLIKLLRNLNSSGFLIFNISINSYSEVILNSYYLNRHVAESAKNLNLDAEINSIFRQQILEPIALNLESLYKILWRIPLKDESYLLEDFLDFFIIFSVYNFQNLLIFSNQFEKILKLNQIEVHRINTRLLLIEQKVLFLIIDKLEIDLIEKIFKKYLPSHQIFLFVMSLSVYNKILELDKIMLLKNLKLLSYKDIVNFDFLKLKKL